ncbi:MAG: alpha-mannosidase [Clostridiales bacterium]|nr:alpha-mannosidase [Clostridiales bacterium]
MIVKDMGILENAVNELRGGIYHKRQVITGWESCVLRYETPDKYELLEEWKPIELGERWPCDRKITRRFRVKVPSPGVYDGVPVMLVLDVGGEGLVHINGEIVSGLTSYVRNSWLGYRMRNRVRIPEHILRAEVLEIEIETCLNFLEATYTAKSGPNMEPQEEYYFTAAEMVWLDTEKEALYYDLRNAMDAIRAFESPFLPMTNVPIQMPEVMRRPTDMLSRDGAIRERIGRAILKALQQKNDPTQARRILKENLQNIAPSENFEITFVGHAHIDTAWLWSLNETIRKCAKTFANVLDLMERYDEFVFSFSQPQLFEYVERYYPELFEKIKQRVAEGRIELVGNAWVEMDTNVPSGESIVRQLLYGRQYYLSRFGKESRVFWMPDVFGYSWAMPQILKRSGVDYFYTSKLANNDTNSFPYSLFEWQGTDGTRVLSYLQRIGYNGIYNANEVKMGYDKFSQKANCDEAMLTFGHGDGGGGPAEEMLENARRLKAFPGLAKAKNGRADEFFDSINAKAEDLPVWNDEMYYENHRGTYTSQAHIKRFIRLSELALRRLEIAWTMAHLYCGAAYPAKEIGDLWKILLTRQFHDILPGSSIHEVYEECEVAFEKLLCEANAMLEKAFALLAAKFPAEKGECYANFLPWEHNGVAPFGFGLPKNSGKLLRVTERMLENEHLLVELDENGNIIRLYDKDNDREVLAKGALGNQLILFEDKPRVESAWNIDLEYQNFFELLNAAESVSVVNERENCAVVRVVRVFGSSRLEQDIILERDARRVDFVTRVDWHEREKMLKTAFPVRVHARNATYEIQFGSIERPTHWNTAYDRARFEVCGHKWADISEGGYGVSLMNDCKYGYDIKDNVMRLTLLRGPVYPDPMGDDGEHVFTYSLYPHAGDWRQGETVREAYFLNEPLVYCPAIHMPEESFVKVDKNFAVVDTIKGAEDGNGVILRIYESQGARGKVNVALARRPLSIAECNLMEVDEDTIPMNEKGFSFEIEPYEVRTFRMKY